MKPRLDDWIGGLALAVICAGLFFYGPLIGG